MAYINNVDYKTTLKTLLNRCEFASVHFIYVKRQLANSFITVKASLAE